MPGPTPPAWSSGLEPLHHAARDAARALAHRAGSALADSRPGGAVEIVPLDRAAGRTAAHDVRAACPVPHYASSAMDGYAVHGPGPWRVVAPGPRAGASDGRRLDDHLTDSAAPSAPLPSAASAVTLAPGTAVPVVTGGVIPDGTTTVIREEFATRRGELLELSPDSPRTELAGRHIRPAGTECARDETVVRAGTVLSPAHAAFLAVAGRDDVPVRSVPRVALLLTGSEVRTSGLPAPGYVRDAFSMSLPPMVQAFGGRTVTVRRGPDHAAALRSLFRELSAEHDLVVTTGGTSRSRADFVRPMVQDECHVIVDQLDLMPGHPTLFGAARDTAVLALPGNPLGAMVAFLLLGGAFLAGQLGREPRPFAPAVAGEELAGARSERLLPARRHNGGWVPCRAIGSNMVRGLAAAEGLLSVPREGLARGQETVVLPPPW
ncbi:molybdopterin molybdotransferase MoeA [Kocuria marina]|uniref:molybdopterin molybdotransferase MoeA n=1 Tax=Kocuria marina TaxID=223184 RepID=UPI0011A692E4|nr:MULTISPECIES: molybdopterin molybdotransferase MoeA [Kocuria]MCT2021868.1 molybdopterin molybdotransferase MoeA [Kocuria marina]